MSDTDCVFCDIVAGDAHALVVDETAETLAFSPLDPFAPGHVLVIPKAHHESLFDVPADALADVTEHARVLARELCGGERGFDGANLFNDSTSYQSVPHLHLHVVGRRADDPDLFPETEYDGDREDAHAAVTAALEADGDRDSAERERESVK
ncbi:HIT family protein [Halorubellus litoreus]|uniref:HIT family protein n=1 Tax=Halorubellus litoreus TaxID=755308 RepID=A0ABD5VCF7_9EURY